MKHSENRMRDGIQKRSRKSYRIAVWYTDQATGKKKLHTETVTGTEDHAKARKLAARVKQFETPSMGIY